MGVGYSYTKDAYGGANTPGSYATHYASYQYGYYNSQYGYYSYPSYSDGGYNVQPNGNGNYAYSRDPYGGGASPGYYATHYASYQYGYYNSQYGYYSYPSSYGGGYNAYGYGGNYGGDGSYYSGGGGGGGVTYTGHYNSGYFTLYLYTTPTPIP